MFSSANNRPNSRAAAPYSGREPGFVPQNTQIRFICRSVAMTLPQGGRRANSLDSKPRLQQPIRRSRPFKYTEISDGTSDTWPHDRRVRLPGSILQGILARTALVLLRVYLGGILLLAAWPKVIGGSPGDTWLAAGLIPWGELLVGVVLVL